MSDKIEIIAPTDHSDKLWYSHVRAKLEDLKYGKVDVELTVKNGKVVMIRFKSEQTVMIQNET